MTKNAKTNVLAALRAQIQAIELGAAPTNSAQTIVPLGIAEIDCILPWAGLPRTAIHEIEGEHGAALGFAVALLARFVANHRPALWCFRQLAPYAPGLRLFGLDPNRLIAVRARKTRHILWALEEALRARCLGAVLGEISTIDLTSSKRLQLATRIGGTACILLCNNTRARTTTAATRWRILPSKTNENDGGIDPNFLVEPSWQIELVRCRGTSGGHRWTVKWCHETHCLNMVAPLAHRPRTSPVKGPRNAV